MKKITIRFLTLFLILLLATAFPALPVSAAEEAEAYEGTPLFLVAIVDSEGKVAGLLNAFLVHDPETGGTFLLGSSVIYDLKNDYAVLLLGDGDYATQAAALGKTGGVTYLYAPGLENAPYLVLSESNGTQAAVVYRELGEKQVGDPIQKNYDLSSGWKESSNGFLTYTGHEVDSMCMVGAPMVLTSDSSVLGSVTMDGDENITLAPIARGALSTQYCIETLSGGSPAPDGDSPSEESTVPDRDTSSKESPTGNSPASEGGSSGSNQASKPSYIWLLVIGAAAAFFWFRRRQTDRKQGGRKEGTIPLDQPFAVPEQPSPSVPPQEVPVPSPAVRDMDGRIYQTGSSQRLSFGRSSRNPVCIEDASVSGSHCVLYREDGRLYLMDLGSTNGTFFSQQERLKPNTPYRIHKGMAFFLTSPSHTFVVIEE